VKILSGSMLSILGDEVTQPGLLVEIDFSPFPIKRWSSHSNRIFDGRTFTAETMRIDDLSVDGVRVSGTLVLGNTDWVMGSLLMTQGIQDRPITVWAYDAHPSGEVIWVCSAVGGAVEINENDCRVELRGAAQYLTSPRTYVTPDNGFNVLLAAGTVLRINGQDIRLDRRS
jgi:hypothetical protein